MIKLNKINIFTKSVIFAFSAGILFMACASNEDSGNAQKDPVIEEYTANYEAQFSDVDLPKDDSIYTENQFGKKTALEITEDMGFGWCLGNTMEANSISGLASETSWGQPETTKEMIDFLSNEGVKTLRLPVTWHNHLIDENYTIDPQWLARVKEIADWALNDGMYVILNTHHDDAEYSRDSIAYGTGFYPQSKDRAESTRFLFNVWSQISEVFNNSYDEHLIFELMNEPHMPDYPEGYTFGYNGDYDFCVDQAECVNLYNQVSLEAIRKSGGNNLKRYVMVSGICAKFDYTLFSGFEFPVKINNSSECFSEADLRTSESHQMISVHVYEPSDFTGNTDEDRTCFTDAYKVIIQNYFRRIYEEYISKGIAVVDGEYGTIDKNNTSERVKWIKFYIETARKFNVPCCYWDNNGSNKNKTISLHTYGLFDRKNLCWRFPEIAQAGIKAAETPFDNNPLENLDALWFDNFIENPVSFDQPWKKSITIPSSVFYYLEAGTKIEITISPLKEKPNYRQFAFFYGNWDGHFIFTADEITGGTMPEGKNNVTPAIDSGKMTFVLNQENLDKMKQYGMHLMGYGFTIDEIVIM